MLGAIGGDIIGSVYEINNTKSKNFDLFIDDSIYTDDSVMTCAVANACVKYDTNKSKEQFQKNLVAEMQYLGLTHIHAGYGGHFIRWLFNPRPYGSYGNGSAMRVSPIGWISESMSECLELAEISAIVSHNHPEGIKGARCVAAAVFLARNGHSKDDIKKYIMDNFYDLNFTIKEIHDSYKFDVSCQGSVPEALVSFLESDSYEDTVRTAISIGGDSDTIAAIAGSIAEAYYGIPDFIKDKSVSILDDSLRKSVYSFYELLKSKNILGNETTHKK